MLQVINNITGYFHITLDFLLGEATVAAGDASEESLDATMTAGGCDWVPLRLLEYTLTCPSLVITVLVLSMSLSGTKTKSLFIMLHTAPID